MPVRRLVAPFLLVCSTAMGQGGGDIMLPLHDGRDAYAPAAAYGNGAYLVAWQSGRLAPGDIRKGLTLISDIVACRIDAAGKVLDERPAVICAAVDGQEKPRVACDGRNFLVTWQDLRNGKDWDVYAARIGPDGKVLDPDGFLVAGGPHNQALPRVAWDGRTFIVVWQDMRSGSLYEAYAARVGSDGKVIDADGIRVAAGTRQYHRYTPAVAPAGEGRSLVMWLGNIVLGMGTTAGAVFLTDGRPADAPTDLPRQTVGAGNQCNPVSLAGGAGGFLAAWSTEVPMGRGSGSDKANAVLLAADGRLAHVLLLGGRPHRIRDPDVVWTGADYVAVWHEFTPAGGLHDELFMSRISRDGKVQPAGLRIAGSFDRPASMGAVASDGHGNVMIAWEQHPDNERTPITIAARLVGR